MARFAALVVGCLLALAAAQTPEFTQQYQQRLGGALAELQSFVRDFEADAQRAGLTPDQAIAEYAHSQSSFLAERGARAATLVRRFERLQREQQVLRAASPLTRGWVLARSHDADLLHATMTDFAPALPTSGEGLVYGLGGFLAGYLLATLSGSALRRAISGRRRLTTG